MSITVEGRVPRSWGDETASHITRRFQALERALRGGQDRFLSPATPAFGPGTLEGGAGTAVVPSGSSGGTSTVVNEVVDDEDWERHFMGMGA